MEKIGVLFEKYVIILYYDNSNDNTLELLEAYKQKYPERLLFYKNEKEISPFRTFRLAHGRNACLNVVRRYYADYPFFIMMDCDDVCSQDVNTNVLSKYLKKNKWDALSFNKSNYYDIWALSIRPYSLSYLHYEPDSPNVNAYITDLLRKVPPNGLLHCSSAFNGFAIYRANKFLNCYYDGRMRLDLIPNNHILESIKVAKKKFNKNKTVEDCEHRSFHYMAIKRNKARIRISSEILFL